MTSWVVRYHVEGHGGHVFETEPYDSFWLAEEHRRDIAGYEGVHTAHVAAAEFTRPAKEEP